MGKPELRLQHCLNYNAEVIFSCAMQDHAEIIVNDWGSDVLLRKVLKLTDKARRITHFLEVKLDSVKAVQRDSPFAEVLAHNVSARRARGVYYGRIDQDTLIDPKFFQAMVPILKRQKHLGFDPSLSFMFSGRRSIPIEFTERDPSLSDVIRIMEKCKRLFPKEGQGRDFWFEASTGVMILSRQLWYECGGYDERLIYWGRMETDLAFRIGQRYPLIDLDRWLNFAFYHLNHAPRQFMITARKKNRLNRHNDFHPNNEEWGYPEWPLTLRRCKTTSYEAPTSDMGSHSVIRIGQYYYWSLKELIWESFRFILRRILFAFGIHAGSLAESKTHLFNKRTRKKTLLD
jgi:hypothetical protein